ncbi:MAG: hypothetical protein JO337_11045 [Acidimicrobiales bacterium]|nr:hypothetical protein [Acidimicrobiales bacterium]
MKRRSLPALLGALTVLIPSGQAIAAAGGAAATTVSIVHRPMLARSVFDDNVQSSNWSGYAVSTTNATKVVGSWTVPTASCSRRSSTYASFWVGLDGYSSNSVEQLGTDSDCSRGAPTYYAWFEMYPAPSVSLSRYTYPVRAGDTLTAAVTRSGTSYTLSLTDPAEGWQFSQAETGSDADASAEWVAEAPELCNAFYCSLANLTNFGTVTFSGAKASDATGTGSISSFAADGDLHDITMVTSTGAVKAQPSGLDGTGSTFRDTWYHA